MSKFSLPTFLFASLIFISFTTNPGQGVTRLGKFTYNVSSTARVQESEKQEILSILKATYGIKDVNTARVAILPTKTFGIFFPNTPLINPPINGSAIINGMSC